MADSEKPLKPSGIWGKLKHAPVKLDIGLDPFAAEVTKESIRQAVWNFLEKNDIANFPRPVKNRIPNFKGAEVAGQKVSSLSEFCDAMVVKVNPDKPQEEVRYQTLVHRKTLLVPTPRLKQGLFNKLVNPGGEANTETLRKLASRYGLDQESRPVSLDTRVTIDLVVLGSVAVDRMGHRIGKGEGFADLEFAMAASHHRAVGQETVVVTTVHDCQVFDQLPEKLFREHDVPVDIIVTPTQVIRVADRLKKPLNIFWNMLTREKMKKIGILKQLRFKEKEAGVDVTLKEEEGTNMGTEEKRAKRNNKNGGQENGIKESHTRNGVTGKDTNETQSGTEGKNKDENVKPKRRDRSQMLGVFIGSMVRSTRVSDLKKALHGKGVQPSELIWKGGKGIAFAYFDGGDEIFEKLNGLTVCNKEVNVEKIKTQAKVNKNYQKDQTEKKKVVEDKAPVDKKEMRPNSGRFQRKSKDNKENVTTAPAGETETVTQQEKDLEQNVIEPSAVTIDHPKQMEVDSIKPKQDEGTGEKTNATLKANKNECVEPKENTKGEKIVMKPEVKNENQDISGPISVDMVTSKQVGMETNALCMPTEKVKSGDKTGKPNQETEEKSEIAITAKLESSLVLADEKENPATNVTEMTTLNKECELQEKSLKPKNKEENIQQQALLTMSDNHLHDRTDQMKAKTLNQEDQAEAKKELNKSDQNDNVNKEQKLKEEGIAVPKAPEEKEMPKVPERSKVVKTENGVSHSKKGENTNRENDEPTKDQKFEKKVEGIPASKAAKEEAAKMPDGSKVQKTPKHEVSQSKKGENTKEEIDEVTRDEKLAKNGEGIPAASKTAKGEEAPKIPGESKVEKSPKNEESQSKKGENSTEENVKESPKTDGKPSKGDDPEKCSIS